MSLREKSQMMYSREVLMYVSERKKPNDVPKGRHWYAPSEENLLMSSN
jgi:hypothetical protein